MITRTSKPRGGLVLTRNPQHHEAWGQAPKHGPAPSDPPGVEPGPGPGPARGPALLRPGLRRVNRGVGALGPRSATGLLRQPCSIYEQASPSSARYSAHSSSSSVPQTLHLSVPHPFSPPLPRLGSSFSPPSLSVGLGVGSSTPSSSGLQVNVCAATAETCTPIGLNSAYSAADLPHGCRGDMFLSK